MKYVIYDTETTGLNGFDEVVQLAYIVLDENFFILDANNAYFYPTCRMNKKAESVNGLSLELLAELSGGATFDEFVKTDKYFSQVPYEPLCFVAYNAKFDTGKVNGTLDKFGVPRVYFGNGNIANNLLSINDTYSLCMQNTVTRINGGRIKLFAAVEQYVTDPNKIDDMADSIAKQFNVFTRGNSYHDAFYDTVATTMLFYSVYR